MLILGKTGDDKGAQLEKLAASMLESKGYERIRLNAVGSGSSEYDLTAVFSMPGFGDRPNEIAVMGECKARRASIDMNDWQKFIGKIYLEKLRTGTPIYGLYITTSVVKATVQSSADDLSDKFSEIKVNLVTAAKIEEFLRRRHHIKSRLETMNETARFTTREVVEIRLCYYADRCYQLVRFGGAYTLLAADGSPLSGESLDEIKILLGLTEESDVSGLRFVDLQEEKEAKLRSLILQKHILARLMLAGGSISLEGLAEDTAFNSSEIKDAVAGLENLGWIETGSDALSLSGVENGKYPHFTDVIRFWLDEIFWPGGPLREMLSSRFYHEQIDEELLEHILKIQAGLPLPTEDRPKLLQIFRLSPSALVTALRPIQMITHDRHLAGMRQNDRINATDLNLFYEKIIAGVRRDFNILGLEEHILNYQGVFELEENLILKRVDQSNFELASKTRHQIFTSNTDTGFIRLAPIHEESDVPLPESGS